MRAHRTLHIKYYLFSVLSTSASPTKKQIVKMEMTNLRIPPLKLYGWCTICFSNGMWLLHFTGWKIKRLSKLIHKSYQHSTFCMPATPSKSWSKLRLQMPDQVRTALSTITIGSAGLLVFSNDLSQNSRMNKNKIFSYHHIVKRHQPPTTEVFLLARFNANGRSQTFDPAHVEQRSAISNVEPRPDLHAAVSSFSRKHLSLLVMQRTWKRF